MTLKQLIPASITILARLAAGTHPTFTIRVTVAHTAIQLQSSCPPPAIAFFAYASPRYLSHHRVHHGFQPTHTPRS